MKKETKTIVLDGDKWDVYTIIDFTVAIILVVISMVSADIPRQRIEIVKKPAPYVARGWTPAGQQLNLPLRAVPTPAPSYGPPPEAEATTTEESTTEETTETANAEKSQNIEAPPKKENLEKLEEPENNVQGQYYVVLPQGQNLVYTIPRSAALLAVPKNEFVTRGEFLAATPARLQAVPLTSTVASSVYTPFSASYIQIYQ